MAGLKRQARKAERYKKQQERIRELDMGITLHYYDDYTHKIEEADALLTDLKDTDIEHTSKLKKLDALVEKIKLQRSQKNQEISDQKSRKFETQRNIDRTENDLAHIHKDVERLTYETKELESAHADLEEKNRNLIAEVAQVENQEIGIHAKIKTINSTLDQERSASQNIKDQLAVLNQELETCKTNLMDLVAQEAQYKNIYQNATSNKEGLQRRLKMLDKEEAAASHKVAELRDKKTKAEKQLGSYKKEIDDLGNRIDIIQKQLEQKSKSLGRQVKHAQTLELERNQTKSTYTSLKKMEDNFEWYKDGVRIIMKKSHTDKDGISPGGYESPDSDGILGLMADIVEPEPSFETAVEAALGESLQHILVKDQKAGLGAIDYLQTTGAGRSGFIPVSSVKNIESNRKSKPDLQKRLLNHISVKQGFEKTTEALLGHVVVAADIEEAIKLFNSNGTLQTVVTKEGDIISHQGIMIGGSKDNLSGILVKKQELKAIERQIKSTNQKLESARHGQKELESEVRIIESDLQKLIELKNKTTQSEVEAEKALYKTTEDLKHALRHLEIVRLEQEQLLGEEGDIDEKIVRCNRAVTEIENDIKAAQNRVSKKLEQISLLSSEMEDFNQKVVDLKLKLTTLNAKLENSNNTLRRLKEFRNDGTKQLEQLSDDISQKKQKRVTSKQKVKEYEQTLCSMYDDLKLLKQALENNESDYNTIDAQLKDTDTTISDIQSRREKTLQQTRLLELDQSQRQIQRQNIANRLEENYHSPLAVLKSEFDEMSNHPELSVDEMEDELTRLRKKIANIDDINLGAIKEYEQLKDRFYFLNEQRDDLIKAVDDLHKVIKKINRITKDRFLKTFDAVNDKLNEVFPLLFEGGSAKLVLTEPDNPLETGVEFMIHPPGKKLTRMSLLSGGEKALSAIALIFSIFLIKPAYFCLMDEIDAPLDDANIFRINDLLQIIGEKSQIIMITHNKKTMEFADTLFGVTMEKKGVSKVVSVNFNRPE
jgi:chromosome segregation protein